MKVSEYKRGKLGNIEIANFDISQEKGLLSEGDVIEILDKLPTNFFECIPLCKVKFVDKCMYTKVLDGKILYRETKRTNMKIDGERLFMGVGDEGRRPFKKRIEILSTKNWDYKGDDALDLKQAKYALGTAIAELLAKYTLLGEKLFKLEAYGRRKIPTHRMFQMEKLSSILNKEWFKLGPNKIDDIKDRVERFGERAEITIAKGKQTVLKNITADQLSGEYDFALTLGRELIDANVDKYDKERAELLEKYMKALGKIEPFKGIKYVGKVPVN